MKTKYFKNNTDSIATVKDWECPECGAGKEEFKPIEK